MVNPKRIRYRYCQACPAPYARELDQAISWKDSQGETENSSDPGAKSVSARHIVPKQYQGVV